MPASISTDLLRQFSEGLSTALADRRTQSLDGVAHTAWLKVSFRRVSALDRRRFPLPAARTVEGEHAAVSPALC